MTLIKAINKAQEENAKLSAIYEEATKEWEFGRFEKAAELRQKASEQYELVLRLWDAAEQIRWGIEL